MKHREGEHSNSNGPAANRGAGQRLPWHVHLRWLFPLLLLFILPVLVYISFTTELAADHLWARWIIYLTVIPVIPSGLVGCFILVIVQAQHVWCMTPRGYARTLQKRSDFSVSRGGPALDLETRRNEFEQAREMVVQLSEGRQPSMPQPVHLRLNDGENLVRIFRAEYGRFYGTTVTYSTGGGVVIGNPLFLAGALVGSAVNRGRARKNAERMAAAQWRETQFVEVIVTDRRFIIPIAGRHLSFWFTGVQAFYPDLTRDVLVLEFGDTEPLRLIGPATASASVQAIYAIQGREGVKSHPALDGLRG